MPCPELPLLLPRLPTRSLTCEAGTGHPLPWHIQKSRETTKQMYLPVYNQFHSRISPARYGSLLDLKFPLPAPSKYIQDSCVLYSWKPQMRHISKHENLTFLLCFVRSILKSLCYFEVWSGEIVHPVSRPPVSSFCFVCSPRTERLRSDVSSFARSVMSCLRFWILYDESRDETI